MKICINQLGPTCLVVGKSGKRRTTLPYKERKLNLTNLITGIFAFALLALVIPMGASAGSDTEPYPEGDVKEAIASGETVFLHYKSTW